MKFGHLLKESAAATPDLEGLWVCYKQLKKRLKALPPAPPAAAGASGAADAGGGGGEAAAAAAAPPADAASSAPSPPSSLTAAEAAFAAELAADIRRFNHEFMEREEDAVIRLRSLEDDAAAALSAARSSTTPALAPVAAAYKRAVNFHGELLIVVHWSILAYTGLVKILKKHHKRTGMLVRGRGLSNLLSQPFCSVELITSLAKKTEAVIESLGGALGEREGGGAAAATAPAPLPRSGAAAATDMVAAARAKLSASVEGGDAGGLVDSESDDDEGLPPPPPAAAAATAAALPPPAPTAAAPPPPHPLPASMLRQTEAALGLWTQLHETAATPSTVLAPGGAAAAAAVAARAAKRARVATSMSTDASAA